MIDHPKLAAARLLAAEQQPFLSVALYALNPVDAPDLDTFAVDERWRLSIGPSAMERWTVQEVAGVLLHEVGHVVRDHAGRARAAFVDRSTALLWNIAGDAEINGDLIADRVVMPADGVTPRRLGLPPRRAAEFYFSELLRRHEPPDQFPNCGSGAHGVDGHGDPTSVGSEEIGLDPSEADLVRRQVAVAIIQQRSAGTVPLGWARWAEAWATPTIDWRTELRSRVRRGTADASRGRTDYSYGRPSRRRVPGVVMPSMITPSPRVAVVIDTSASVDDAMLASAWAEVRELMRSAVRTRRDVTVWAVDARAHRIAVVGRGHRVELLGGGGTDMRVGIADAMGARPRPDLIVVLTDGETPWPDSPGAVPVLAVLLTRDDRARPHLPGWIAGVEVPVGSIPARTWS